MPPGLLAVLIALPAAGRTIPPPPQPDSAVAAALVRALIPVVTAELAGGRPPFGDERSGTPAWRAWRVRAPAAGPAAEAALRAAVLRATGARAFPGGEGVWSVLAVEGVAVAGDTAVVEVDRGTRYCYARSGPGASGYTYRYAFARAGAGWRFVRVTPHVAYDPPPPPPAGAAPASCAA
jgi:hypothetical protein